MTEYQKSIKMALVEREKSVGWLCEMIRRKTGLYCDPSYLSKIYRGARPAKIVTAINEILGVNDGAG